MSNIINKIRLSGTDYTLSATTSGGVTSGEVETMISAATSGYTARFAEDEEVTARALNELNDALSGKQDTLVSATNIKTINNESILGSGNIDIQGGGKAISGGTNISITTGETADTINCTLSGGTLINISNNKINCSAPIRYGTGSDSIIVGSAISTNKATGMNSIANGGDANTASGQYSYAEGFYTQSTKHSSHSEGWFTKANGQHSHSEGNHTVTNKDDSHAEGKYTVTNNTSEHASGQYNNSVTGSSTFGDSGNTLFSVGNGTADNARHNAFEIRQNGDIYLTLNGQDVKLQDKLGGSSITVDSALDSGSTNPVENRVIYNKIDEVEQVTARALNELNESKQDTLVSGTNIKTINNVSILGSGNIDIQGGGGGTVESAITSGSTNAVESKAIWSATTFNKGVLLTFNGNRQSTNYPEGCGKLVVENIGSNNISDITFRKNGSIILGIISITNFGDISVDTSRFEGATATVDGNKVTIIYPSTGITYVEVINTRWTYTAVVEGAWVNENTYMKSEVDAIANNLQNNINSKLDATAYTPTVVDSALNSGSTNAVQNQALYSELRIDNGQTETTLTFENRYSTNYPNGSTKLIVEVVGDGKHSTIEFFNDNSPLGNINIDIYGGGIHVYVSFDGATYEISGTTVIINYPTVTTVTKIKASNDSNYVFKAVVANATSLKDQVVANTTALGVVEDRLSEDEEVTAAGLNAVNDKFDGLQLKKLTQAEYDALTTKDSNTLYIVI